MKEQITFLTNIDSSDIEKITKEISKVKTIQLDRKNKISNSLIFDCKTHNSIETLKRLLTTLGFRFEQKV